MSEQVTLDSVGDLIEMAGIYAGDGAFLTAAMRLEEAARQLKALARQKADGLTAIANSGTTTEGLGA